MESTNLIQVLWKGSFHMLDGMDAPGSSCNELMSPVVESDAGWPIAGAPLSHLILMRREIWQLTIISSRAVASLTGAAGNFSPASTIGSPTLLRSPVYWSGLSIHFVGAREGPRPRLSG